MARSLDLLKTGESSRVIEINKNAPLYNRFIDLGILKGTLIKKVGTSPLGDPSAYSIRGFVVAIRDLDSRDIFIK